MASAMAVQPQQEMATVDDFAISLRSSLRQAAQASLESLDALITNDGYDWLDGYMASIMDRTTRAPIAELIKTPSRTGGATAKKTRAAAAAMTARAEKIKGLNARLGITPKKATNGTRVPFSPLQTRDVNVFLASPSSARTQGLNSPLSVKPQGASKSKAKSKKKALGAVDTPIIIDTETTPKAPKTKKTASKAAPVAMKSLSPAVDRPTEAVTPVVKEDVPMTDNQSEEQASGGEAVIEQTSSHPEVLDVATKDDVVAVPANQEEHKETDLSAISEEKSLEVLAPIVGGTLEEGADTQEDSEELELEADLSLAVEEEEEEEVEVEEREEESNAAGEVQTKGSAHVPAPVSDNAVPLSLPAATPPSTTVDAPESSPATQDMVVPLKDEDDMPKVAQVAATAPVARNVRSSWLSKALTAGESSGLRKSYAPGAHAALMGQASGNDFGGLRKSLVPIGGLSLRTESSLPAAGVKRTSTDAALDLDHERKDTSDESGSRPEKVLRTVHPVLQNAALEAPGVQTAFQLSRSIASSSSLPQPGVPSQPTTTDLSKSVSQPERPRSDIHKLTKALEDMREKAAAKARIAAAAAAHSNTLSKPTATSTGTGFLRGLGSLGISLGMSLSGKPKDEPMDDAAVAAAAAAEAEADALATAEAEAELAALMALSAPKSVKKPGTSAETQPKAIDPALLIMDSPVPPNPLSFDQFFGSFPLDRPADQRSSNEPVLMDQPSMSPVLATEVTDLGAESEEEEEEEEEGEEEKDDKEEVEQPQVPEESTTPVNSPPKVVAPSLVLDVVEPAVVAPAPLFAPKSQTERPAIFKLAPKIPQPAEPPKHQPIIGKRAQPEERTVDLMEDEDELPEMVEYPVENATKLPLPKTSSASDRTSAATGSTVPSLNSSLSSQAGGLNQSQASVIAGKMLGQKANPGAVKSVQAAALAAKKDQALRDRKIAQRDAAEQRRLQAAQRKADEERRAAEEERKAKIAEQEARAKAKVEAERRRKEREERVALIAKQKAAREKREAAAAAELAEAERLKKAEEEAIRKRKFAPILSKSTNNPAAKRQAQASNLSTSVKGKEPVRPIKQAGPISKMGPSGFRPVQGGAPAAAPAATFVATQSSTATISLVQQPQQDRRPLGPPSRPSHQPQSFTTPLGPGRASSVLQQSRTVLQAQLDQQAIAIQQQVDAVELPDIASEYSDSDDEERQETFQRPQWAESPELRSALERQAHFNPDELFGPIKPLSMEELFKVRQGKFRSRTSSANWSGADRLTRTEEIEYAKRMGFQPLGQQLFRQQGSSGSRPLADEQDEQRQG